MRHLMLEAMSALEFFIPVSTKPKVHFILLHHIRSDEVKAFGMLLDWLKEHYELVSYSDAVQGLNNPSSGKCLAAISFDDGLKNNLNAAREMKVRDISGCFFISPGIIGESNQKVVADYCRDRMLFKHQDSFMDWNDLDSLKADGHELGNHSMSHYYMADLSDSQFHEEVESAKILLEKKYGQIKHFAWPYGQFCRFSKERVGKVLDMGHESCASGERGSHQPDGGAESMCLRRENIDVSWPLRHAKTLIKRGGRSPIASIDTWPA